MLKSLLAIERLERKNIIHHEDKWLDYLFNTREKNVNLELVDSLAEVDRHNVLNYVKRTLLILDGLEIKNENKAIVETVLMWNEVAKAGSDSDRKKWRKQNLPLEIHNIASAEIYALEQIKPPFSNRVLWKEEFIYSLIQTHGLIGQYIRGEVRYKQIVVRQNHISEVDLHEILITLNHCIIAGVSEKLWEDIQQKVYEVVAYITSRDEAKEFLLCERLKLLRQSSIASGENFTVELNELCRDAPIENSLTEFLSQADFWYVEAALAEFTLDEFVKIFLLIKREVEETDVQVTFEPFMHDLHYDYQGKKSVNLYKKRIIEAYLADIPIGTIIEDNIQCSEHVALDVSIYNKNVNLVGVTFKFSDAGTKLIEFCQEAEKHPLYERAIIMLYDFFGFRKDAFDRLQNEQTYLAIMNESEQFKKRIVDYVVGEKVLDIGPGGGFLLDLLEETYPDVSVLGIDIATNVIAELNKKRQREQKSWEVIQGDALDLQQHFDVEEIDTIIFSSIIHEMYSYIPYEGRKFNPGVITQALKSAFDVLRARGRIIIRDGIMTEPKEMIRHIQFKNKSDVAFFKRYVQDFKGREIKYHFINAQTVALPINDCMEFLYTFTWGEEAYPHEVQEQFGYFTPTEYEEMIKETLGETAKIIVLEHYLQKGYEEHLLMKIEISDERGKQVRLPDSTCFIVIEKN